MRLGLCQILVGPEKLANVAAARRAAADAVARGAHLVALPECFNSPYAVDQFAKYAEPIPEVGERLDASASPTTQSILEMARDARVFLVGGSIPERGPDGRRCTTRAGASP